MRYEDFSLSFEVGRGGEDVGVEVLASPAGEGRGALGLATAWPGRTLDELRGLAEAAVSPDGRGPSRHLVKAGGPNLTLTPREIGERLYRLLFDGEVRSLLDKSLGMVSPRASADPPGLRLRIHADLDRAPCRRLAALPWELLWSSGEQGFLALSPARSIVRWLDLPSASCLPRSARPLQVLLVLSRPCDAAPLAVDRERAEIAEAFMVQSAVRVTVLEAATVAGFRDALDREEFQVVHFIGHGAAEGEYLLFEAPDGKAESVAASQFARLLQLRQTPSLVVLNACESARLGDSGNADPTGLPFALLRGGVPAVVAMQFPISDGAAIAFSSGLYEALAHGEGIDSAVHHGRLAIHLRDEASAEWATPALFLRTTGRLFELPVVPPVLVAANEPLTPSVTAPTAKRLQGFQRDLYRRLDDLGIRSLADFGRLTKFERDLLGREILQRIIGLGTRPEDLLELSHLNARFPGTDLLQGDPARSIDVLHRKTALYADHSLVCLPSVTLPGAYGGEPDNPFDERTLALLLQHRALVEAGRMSIVPEVVRQRGTKFRAFFDVRSLQTVEVEFNDPTIRQHFLTEDEMYRPVGALVFQAREGGCLPLAGLLEVEERFAAEYRHFQTSLKASLLRMNPDDETKPLAAALQQVDAGIRELEVRFAEARRGRRATAIRHLASGALAVVLYSSGSELAPFVASAVASRSIGSLVQFVTDLRQIPKEVRTSPYFVPWLVARGGRLPLI